ncbi:Ribonuclease P protein subunit p30 [Ceratocystis platani]|uniref:Ribonuclease P protein subunit p30 n=1 Tax=Ceratocystis fimbriata f. sp. platani TaxID=88771 RepID=A0A0F8B1D3_CERFI|nr:Ribonuclease P protein subunit p30 [Ceratocystis platani]
MFDLNIGWPPKTTSDSDAGAELDALLAYASTLGYKTVALNTNIQAPVPVKPPPPCALPASVAAIQSQLQSLSPSPSSHPASAAALPPPQPSQPPRHPTILRRATVILDDPAQNHRLQTLVPLYDILAVRPTSEKAFLSACLNIQDFPLISLDLTQRHPYPFRPKPCMTAISRGLRFEVCYAEMVRGADPALKATWVANFVSLVRATRGRGIVISSGAREGGRALDLRAPVDLVNLLEVFGLQRERGSEAVREVPRGLVVNEGIKRTGFRGVVNVVKMAGAGVDAYDKKRKIDAADSSGGATEPQMSKRQMRKAKAAAAAAAAVANPAAKKKA